MEKLLNKDGTELLRRLFQGHLDVRSATEARVGTIQGSDDIVRSYWRKDFGRNLETVFGTVKVNSFQSKDGEDSIWEYVELGDRRSSWKKFRRAFFCRPLGENGQLLLPFARPSTIIYTKLGMGQTVDQQLAAIGLIKRN